MKDWWPIAELMQFEGYGLPGTHWGLVKYAEEHWDRHTNCWREVEGTRGRNGVRREYHRSLLPASLQLHLKHLEIAAELQEQAAKDDGESRRESLWEAFYRAPVTARAEAERRVTAVNMFWDLEHELGAMVAFDYVARKLDVTWRSVMRWRDMLGGVPKQDWLPTLLAESGHGRPKSKVHPDALEYIIADYVRNEAPSFKSCYDRLEDAAKVEGWGKLPSPKTLKRHVDAEVPYETMVLYREGLEAAKKLVPAQERDKSCFHAMQAVNADGHVANNLVLFPDGSICRPTLVGFQDLYSSTLLSGRLGKTEDTYLIQLAAADMIAGHGIPEDVWFDNGSAFWSKILSGGSRKGFLHKDQYEPLGLLPALGATVHATSPYHGQAKPVERVWKVIADRVAKHPACAGSYTGKNAMNKPDNYGTKAVPLETYEQILRAEIERFNHQEGRRTRIAAGRSYAQVFAESYEQAAFLIKKATPHQQRTMLLKREEKLVRKPEGAIHMLGNRYWCEDLTPLQGRKVTVRYDPQNPHADLFVYSKIDDRFITRAPVVEAEMFNDPEAAKRIGALRSAMLKGAAEGLRNATRFTPEDVAAMTPGLNLTKKQTKVVGLKTANVETVDYAEFSVRSDEDREISDAFGRGIAAHHGVDSVFDLVRNEREDG